MKRSVLVVLVAILICGCATRPPVVSTDAKANYEHVFAGMEAPEPIVVNSRVERWKKRFFGVETKAEYNGLWEFELVASRAWVDEVKLGAGGIAFSEIDFPQMERRQWAEWFRPTADQFSAWKLQGGLSYARAHLFIENEPESEERVRVFVRRF